MYQYKYLSQMLNYVLSKVLSIGGHYSKVEQDAALTFAGATVVLSALAWQDDWGTGFLAGAGYDYDLNDDVQIRGAYSYYDSLGGLDEADMHFFTVGIKF